MISRTNFIIITFLIFTITSIQISNGQPETLWTKTFGGSSDDVAYSVQQTSDGGYIVTGYTESFGAGKNDVWLLKIDSNGDTSWTKTFGGSNDDEGNEVQQTSDGGYIVTGYTESFGAGEKDVWLLKTDSNGDTSWTKTIGGDKNESGFSVRQTDDGGYIITGNTFSYGAGSYDVWLIKTDDSGDTVWTKTFGGIYFEHGRSVRQTLDGGYILTGYTRSYGAGFEDVWLIKTDASGDTTWTKTAGGGTTDRGYSVQQTTDGGYIIAADNKSWGPGVEDIWLVKTDALGDTLWTKVFGGIEADEGRSVQQTADGGYIVTGLVTASASGNHNLGIIKTDASGDTVWTKSFGGGGHEFGTSVQQTSDGGYIVAGIDASVGAGNRDAWLIRLSSSPEVSVESHVVIANDFALKQNYPNPFNPSTKIEFSCPKRSKVKLEVFNITGRRVATLMDEVKEAGKYSVNFNGSNLSTGLYVYKLTTANKSLARKMFLIK